MTGIVGLGGGGGGGTEDGVEALLECHARIRQFLELAARLAAATAPAPAEVAGAAERVRRYFELALPLHARDEDESLAPRLRGHDPALDAALEVMTREHVEHEAARARLVATCAELVARPERQAELAGRLGDEAHALAALLEAHLEPEERVVFPAARRLLDEAARAALLREVRARRAPG